MKEIQEQQQPESIESSESVSSSNEYAYRPLTTKHRRASSTGTTGDEEYTTDEDELYADEPDCSIGTSHPPHPILKSDLARAATDLFGYAKCENEEEEPTSLFDEDDNKFLSDSSAKPSLFAFNDKSQMPLRRFRNLGAKKSSDKSRSHSEVSKSQSTKPLDFRLNRATLTEKREEEKFDIDSSENDSQKTVQQFCCCAELKASQKQKLFRFVNELNDSASTFQWEKVMAEIKEHSVTKLQEELKMAHEKLRLKDEEIAKLSRIRQDVEAEVEELTASLFQEAHNMVREANIRQATAERLMHESSMKSEVLTAEVTALKTLVLTSTPSTPNPHLHPQIDRKGRLNVGEENQQGLFTKKHRRSPSHFNLKYGREISPDSPKRERKSPLPIDKEVSDRDCEKEREYKDFALEVDPRVHTEFLIWKANPCIDKNNRFVARVFREDIDLCLDFPNEDLGAKVRQAVLDGIIFIEAVSDKTKLAFPKKCALLQTSRQCHYRMRLGDQENQWYCISQICRNRIIAVCDCLNYLRYVERGLVKSSVHDIYWEIARLRKEMVLARLGLALSS